jgi:3-oxoacyl-[acyl-carrier-protein] synthase II
MPEEPRREPSGGEAARRVVVTGAGMVTALGADLTTTFDAMQAGRSGVRRLTRFDPTGLPCDIGAEIDVATLIAPHPLDEAGDSELRLLRHATRQALASADLGAVADRHRIAVAIGGHGCTPDARLMERNLRHTDAPTLLAHLLDARGPVLPIVSACAAGSQALGEGLRLLREGRAEVVVAGGAEPLLSYTYYLGFAILGALSRRYASPETASRPFDRKRNGFVIGEGAAVLVLETLAGARARGRPILGEILGYGDSSDGYRITDMHPEAEGAVQAMRAAIADAGLGPDDVEYVNAHGTSTPINDPTETLACKRVFGDRAYQVPVSSNKSMIGHTIGAAGAIEALLTLEGMRRGVLLPTINQEAKDRRCDLDYVPNEARAAEHHVALSNSFGFGGQNACLCLGSAARVG